MNKEFTESGKDYIVKKPMASENKEAMVAYNQAFGAAIKAGAVLRAKLNEYMREQKIWSDEKQTRFIELAKEVGEGEKKLEKGGFKFKDAVALAKDLRAKREELNDMLNERGTFDSSTAEGQAENAKFQKLLTLCLVYKEDGKPVFSSVDALLNESDETRLKVANRGFDLLGEIYYKLDNQHEHKLTENKFLKEFKLVDEKLRFINSEGQLIDEAGRRINELGQLVNEKGEAIDASGNLIDKDGNLIVERLPFLDDEDKPIV